MRLGVLPVTATQQVRVFTFNTTRMTHGVNVIMCRKDACIFCLLLICQLLTAIYLPEAVAQDSTEAQTETLLGRIFSSPVT